MAKRYGLEHAPFAPQERLDCWWQYEKWARAALCPSRSAQPDVDLTADGGDTITQILFSIAPGCLFATMRAGMPGLGGAERLAIILSLGKATPMRRVH
jgi:hypothetical protein